MTRDEIIATSELAQEKLALNRFLTVEADGKASSDRLAEMGPCMIPCRRISATDIVAQFDKPEDLVIIDDETKAGQIAGTKIVFHKKHESYIRRRIAISKEVFLEHGIDLANPKDEDISFDRIKNIQNEVTRRHEAEIANTKQG